MFRKISLVLSLIVSVSAQATFVEMGDFRDDLKEMAEKNHQPLQSYSGARKKIMQIVHLEQDNSGYFVQDVYCKVKFRNKVGPRKMPDHTKINIEHTWPKSRFGVKKGSAKYRVRVSDLHHLYPSDSRTNSIRGNYIFTQFKSDERISECPTSQFGYVSSIGRDAFEPPTDHKGNVARALFYFAVKYDLSISAHEEFFLRQWNIMDPVDSEEMARNDAVERIQGNRNPFIDDAGYAEMILDF